MSFPQSGRQWRAKTAGERFNFGCTVLLPQRTRSGHELGVITAREGAVTPGQGRQGNGLSSLAQLRNRPTSDSQAARVPPWQFYLPICSKTHCSAANTDAKLARICSFRAAVPVTVSVPLAFVVLLISFVGK